MKITNLPSGALQTNTYLAVCEDTNEGFIVDPGGYNPELTKLIKEENVAIKYIIITHGHSDHIGGISGHKEDFPDAKVVIHEIEAPIMESVELNMSSMFGTPMSPKADILVKDGDKLQVGNLTLEILFTPGHTPGGMSIFIPEAKVCFSGDTLFRQSIGRTDFPGGSYKDLDKSVRTKLYTLPDETQVFPGHMGPTTIGFEKENNPFVTV